MESLAITQEPSVPSGTILVADDIEYCRDLLCAILEVEGYKVVCTADGQEALGVLNSQPIDLALLNVEMPGRNGVSVCRHVKSNPETCLIPVVLVTGLDDSQARLRGIECGADDYLSKPLKCEELLARVRSLLKVKRFTDELEPAEKVLCSLALSIEAKDPYTEGHCGRLSRYCVAMAKRLGLPQEQCVALHRAGILHDTGKIAIPETILFKPGPLTREERIIMQQHPIVGERVCAPLKSLRSVLPLIRHHHERLDGSGYPDKLTGHEIPLAVRILSTVDIYDALTTNRPYRRELSRQEAFVLMKEEVRRGWWDGALVDELERMLCEIPKRRMQNVPVAV